MGAKTGNRQSKRRRNPDRWYMWRAKVKAALLSPIHWPLGYCGMCQRYFVYPKRRHMSTAYVDEKSNYCRVCSDCFKEIEEYWAERWEDYYRGLF